MSNPTDDSKSFPDPTENDIYDRQIRLWGADAQERINKARVLYVNITGVSSEVLKNLVLAGVRAAICDGRPYPSSLSRTPTSFLPPWERNCHGVEGNGTAVAQAMKPQVEELNPLLGECEVCDTPVDDLSLEYLSKFNIVVASDMGLDQAAKLSEKTVNVGGKFFFVHCFGLFGCAMVDLGVGHKFRREVGKDKLSEVEQLFPHTPLNKMVRLKLCNVKDRWHKDGPPKVWAAFKSIAKYRDEHGNWPSNLSKSEYVLHTRQFLEKEGMGSEYLGNDLELKQYAAVAGEEIVPVCAVLGGVLGNEIVKSLSGKGKPANNLLLFDGTDGGCREFVLRES